MNSRFEVYQHQERGLHAVKVGFRWPAFFLTWLWSLRNTLWLPGACLLGIHVVLFVLARGPMVEMPVSIGIFAFAMHVFAGRFASRWQVRQLQGNGYFYRGELPARNSADAIAKVKQTNGVFLPEWRNTAKIKFDILPANCKPVAAIASLTIKSAFRFRLIPFLTFLLLLVVIGLPAVLKSDSTAQGLIQIVISYTLAAVTTILAFVTLWLATGSMAREIEDSLLQMVTVKPIPRWQIWIGKWLGIMTLNVGLLAIAAYAITVLIHLRAQELNPAQREILESELLVARASMKPELPDLNALVEEGVRIRMAKNRDVSIDINALRNVLRKDLEANLQVVRPGFVRRWLVPTGIRAGQLRNQPIFIRTKFRSSTFSTEPIRMQTLWEIGAPGSTNRVRIVRELTTDTFHEMRIPPGLVDENGVLAMDFINISPSAILFGFDEGVELLFRESGFELNLCRGLAIILCWLGLAAAIGLTAASQLNFNVASFLAVSLVTLLLFSGTIATVIEQKSVWHENKEQLGPAKIATDKVLVPMIGGIYQVMRLVQDFSPIDSLSTGRSITWTDLARAYAQCWLLLGSIIAGAGMILLTRRELATAQTN